MKFSILIPVYNEERFILEVLKKVNLQKKNFDLQIIVINDGSTDKTKDILLNNRELYNHLINNEKNEGKGKSIINSLDSVEGDYILIQDADLEYNPDEYSKLIEPITKYNADVVYGSRFKGSEPKRIIYFTNRVANFILSLVASILTNINFSDIETGYKFIRSELLRSLSLKEKSFAIEVEITMKLSKKMNKFYEVGISYNGRTYDEGKKIKLKDGIEALYKIFYYKFFK
tara:strand:+ start:109 stop:798 length:690 start_codon:yes stop_codon:yes gene_type:complete